MLFCTASPSLNSTNKIAMNYKRQLLNITYTQALAFNAKMPDYHNSNPQVYPTDRSSFSTKVSKKKLKYAGVLARSEARKTVKLFIRSFVITNNRTSHFHIHNTSKHMTLPEGWSWDITESRILVRCGELSFPFPLTNVLLDIDDVMSSYYAKSLNV